MAGWLTPTAARGAATLKQYYAHAVVEDGNGVIAPWYKGQNGQLDERLKIAADAYKRYPWVGKDKAVMIAPDFVYNSHWSITPEGQILIPPTNDWMCGDLCQRAWSIIKGLTDYYRYSGDPIAFVYIPLAADYILDYAQTPASDPWPEFPISTPTKGKAYGKCDPSGRNQLDLCAIIGTEMLRAHKLTGNPRYLNAARHWGDVFAEKCNFNPELPPWNRYTDPSVVGWSDVLTGSTTLIIDFLGELIAMGYTGRDGQIVKARDAGRAYIRDAMLPQWIVNDIWGRNYWDWDNPVMCGIVSMCGDHIMKNPTAYPTWKTDLRNILPLIFNRNGADPNSLADAYSGAWAFPESSTCCGTSLSYCQYTAAPTFIRYGVLAQDAWAREIGRRMILMATYDSQENGVVKDGLLGNAVATGEWSNLAHPWPLCQVMEALNWMPEEFGPGRENHIMRSTSVVTAVTYDKGRIAYATFDAPAGTVDVLRLAFAPATVKAGGATLAERADLNANGYTVKPLPNGDCLVQIRHDGAKDLVVLGDDPQVVVEERKLTYVGEWPEAKRAGARGGKLRVAAQKGASARYVFAGNQVRLIGSVDPQGGWADVLIDGVRQNAPLECWAPASREQQVLFSKGGLGAGRHQIEIVARGAGNPLSQGRNIYVDTVQYSAATGGNGCGEGGGPRGAQRMIFGYTGRKDYVDSQGNAWRPATEFIIRSGYGTDAVERSWWTKRRSMYIGNTADPELYRYGIHGKEFWGNLTVGPGRYDVRLMFADTPLHTFLESNKDGSRITHRVKARINGQEVLPDLNIPEAAAGIFKAVDRTFRDIRPKNGTIEIRLTGVDGGEAILQALEIVPVSEGKGKTR